MDDTELKYLGLEHIEKDTGKIIYGYDEMTVDIDGDAIKYYEGNVLFGKLRPYLKKCIVASTDGRCTSELLVLKPEKTMLSQYLKYIMLDDRFINEVNSSTYGAKMPRANWEYIRNMEIPLLSVDEQKEIVSHILDVDVTIDDLILNIKHDIDKLKEYKQSLISEAVTGKIDVREMA